MPERVCEFAQPGLDACSCTRKGQAVRPVASARQNFRPVHLKDPVPGSARSWQQLSRATGHTDQNITQPFQSTNITLPCCSLLNAQHLSGLGVTQLLEVAESQYFPIGRIHGVESFLQTKL